MIAHIRTEWGKIATMVYALFGIPVYILYFMNMGKVDIITITITALGRCSPIYSSGFTVGCMAV